jgi:hypothetical protein
LLLVTELGLGGYDGSSDQLCPKSYVKPSKSENMSDLDETLDRKKSGIEIDSPMFTSAKAKKSNKNWGSHNFTECKPRDRFTGNGYLGNNSFGNCRGGINPAPSPNTISAFGSDNEFPDNFDLELLKKAKEKNAEVVYGEFLQNKNNFPHIGEAEPIGGRRKPPGACQTLVIGF